MLLVFSFLYNTAIVAATTVKIFLVGGEQILVPAEFTPSQLSVSILLPSTWYWLGITL